MIAIEANSKPREARTAAIDPTRMNNEDKECLIRNRDLAEITPRISRFWGRKSATRIFKNVGDHAQVPSIAILSLSDRFCYMTNRCDDAGMVAV